MILNTALEAKLVSAYHADCKFSPNMDLGEIYVNEAGACRGGTKYGVALRGKYHPRSYCVTNGQDITPITLVRDIKDSILDITSFLSGKRADNQA